MSYVTATLEMSRDELTVSNAAATWEDITADLIDISWFAGVEKESDDPQAGGATIRLKSPGRKYEPEFAGNDHIDTGLRFRLTLDDGVTSAQEGVWYAAAFVPEYPGENPQHKQEVVVVCVDGHGLLSLDPLEKLDPPDATTYEEVVMFDEPFGYWRLGDPRTAAKAAAVTGPEGTYKARSQVLLREEGAIVGDSDGSAKFTVDGSTLGRVEVPLASNEWVSSGDSLTVEAWVKRATASSLMRAADGPRNASFGSIFFLGAQAAFAHWSVRVTGGTDVVIDAGPSLGTTWRHLVGVFDSGQSRLYVDGVLVGSTSTNLSVLTPASGSPLQIGAEAVSALAGSDGWLDEIAIYEHALSADRILAHYNAGVSGFAAQMAGERIESVVTSALWAETEIATGHHEVAPVMEHGQSKLEEVLAAVKAEMWAPFSFNGDGNPVYLGWNWLDGASVQATFGAGAGEVMPRVGGLQLEYDDDVANRFTISREGGVAQTADDTASQAKRYLRERIETGLIHTEDEGCRTLAHALLDIYKRPTLRPVSLTLEGSRQTARTQILTREIGDLIRVKRPVETGDEIDRVVHIVKKEKTLDRNGHLHCTWRLSRGFDATQDVWRLGIDGFSELGETTVLA